jgi:hypothetical protein
MLSHDGDNYLVVRGQDVTGEFHQVQLEFIALAGGGYHPRTLEALYNLIEAMERDNKDPESIRRYNIQ